MERIVYATAAGTFVVVGETFYRYFTARDFQDEMQMSFTYLSNNATRNYTILQDQLLQSVNATEDAALLQLPRVSRLDVPMNISTIFLGGCAAIIVLVVGCHNFALVNHKRVVEVVGQDVADLSQRTDANEAQANATEGRVQVVAQNVSDLSHRVDVTQAQAHATDEQAASDLVQIMQRFDAQDQRLDAQDQKFIAQDQRFDEQTRARESERRAREGDSRAVIARVARLEGTTYSHPEALPSAVDAVGEPRPVSRFATTHHVNNQLADHRQYTVEEIQRVDGRIDELESEVKVTQEDVRNSEQEIERVDGRVSELSSEVELNHQDKQNLEDELYGAGTDTQSEDDEANEENPAGGDDDDKSAKLEVEGSSVNGTEAGSGDQGAESDDDATPGPMSREEILARGEDTVFGGRLSFPDSSTASPAEDPTVTEDVDEDVGQHVPASDEEHTDHVDDMGEQNDTSSKSSVLTTKSPASHAKAPTSSIFATQPPSEDIEDSSSEDDDAESTLPATESQGGSGRAPVLEQLPAPGITRPGGLSRQRDAGHQSASRAEDKANRISKQSKNPPSSHVGPSSRRSHSLDGKVMGSQFSRDKGKGRAHASEDSVTPIASPDIPESFQNKENSDFSAAQPETGSALVDTAATSATARRVTPVNPFSSTHVKPFGGSVHGPSLFQASVTHAPAARSPKHGLDTSEGPLSAPAFVDNTRRNTETQTSVGSTSTATEASPTPAQASLQPSQDGSKTPQAPQPTMGPPATPSVESSTMPIAKSSSTPTAKPSAATCAASSSSSPAPAQIASDSTETVSEQPGTSAAKVPGVNVTTNGGARGQGLTGSTRQDYAPNSGGLGSWEQREARKKAEQEARARKQQQDRNAAARQTPAKSLHASKYASNHYTWQSRHATAGV